MPTSQWVHGATLRAAVDALHQLARDFPAVEERRYQVRLPKLFSPIDRIELVLSFGIAAAWVAQKQFRSFPRSQTLEACRNRMP